MPIWLYIDLNKLKYDPDKYLAQYLLFRIDVVMSSIEILYSPMCILHYYIHRDR